MGFGWFKKAKVEASPEPGDDFTIEQVADLADIRVSTVRRDIDRGKLLNLSTESVRLYLKWLWLGDPTVVPRRASIQATPKDRMARRRRW